MNPGDVALEVVARRREGNTRATKNGVIFNLEERGYCSRFVRLCHLAAKLPTGVFGCCAHATFLNLVAKGKAFHGVPQKGHIVVFKYLGGKCSNCGRDVWHIAIKVDEGLVAENTSSGKRGNPRKAGTKISSIDDIGRNRIMGWFSLLED